MDFLTEDGRKNKKMLLLFLDSPTNQEIIYFSRSTHMEERQVEQEVDLDGASDTDSIRSPKMETVQVIFFVCSTFYSLSIQLSECSFFFAANLPPLSRCAAALAQI